MFLGFETGEEILGEELDGSDSESDPCFDPDAPLPGTYGAQRPRGYQQQKSEHDQRQQGIHRAGDSRTIRRPPVGSNDSEGLIDTFGKAVAPEFFDSNWTIADQTTVYKNRDLYNNGPMLTANMKSHKLRRF